MKQTKIDWCDCTVNPVVGCERGCGYCYARKLNNRFGFIKDWSKPQFFPERLKQFDSKKPKSIFINSMSDIAYWETKWVIALFRAMIKNPHAESKKAYATAQRNLLVRRKVGSM